MNTLINTLNDRLKEALVPIVLPVGYNERKIEILRVSANLKALKGRGSKWLADHSTLVVKDTIDWEQMHTNASRPNRKAGDKHLVGKRAKWVSVEEIRARRRERL